jgi:cobalt-zinc-cadmium efflux system protein
VQQNQHVHNDQCSHSHHHYYDLLLVEGDHHDEHSDQGDQGDQASRKVRRLTYVFFLVASFSVIELAIGSYSHSMSLLADAGHLFSDCFALLLALLGAWIVKRSKSNEGGESGDRRVETAIALFNGFSLLVIGGGVGLEAIVQLQSPATEILSLPMLIVAIVGLGVNSINILLLHDHSHEDLNLKGAFLHIIADALSSVGVLVAALAVWKMHWLWADGVISLFIALLIMTSALPLIQQSLKLLMGDRLLSQG